ncbi:acyl-CoA dehydrogenase family protein, partial [Streptomyces venezuelae]
AEGTVVVTAVSEGLVPWLDAADVVVGPAGGAVPVRSVDPLTPLHRVPAKGGAEAGVEVLLTAAEQVGSAGRTTEMAVSYAREREQFGQVIGGFQAVKHLCAGMLVRTELARAAVRAASLTADPVEIAGAKLLADEAATGNARDCLQVHGGMGFTWEADVHLHLKRAWVRSELRLPPARAEETVAAGL